MTEYRALRVNEAVNSLSETFVSVLDDHAVKKQKRIKNRIQPVWFNSKIKEAIVDRDREKRKGNMTAYKGKRNKVLTLVRKAKKEHYHKALVNGKGNSKLLWKNIRELTGSKQTCSPVMIKSNDELLTDPEVISNEFNKYFTQVAESILRSETTLSSPETYEPFESMKTFIDNHVPTGEKFSIPYITEEQALNALLSLDTTKATGTDEMSSKCIKAAAPALARHLSFVINTSIKSGIFPNLWKHAKVFPIYKSGEHTEMNNYRPISVLNILSKIFEKHVHDSLYSYLIKYNLLSENQSGFRKGHSCETGLVSFMNTWHKHIDNHKIIGCVNIDLRKAFDLVNYDILCKKLRMYGCSDLTVTWFESYLKNRKQNVIIDKCASSSLNVNHGVPQGSVLGPLLFILFINDLPLCLSNTHIHMYADDTSLFAIGNDIDEVNQKLNNDLIAVSKWFKCNMLIVNELKTNCMLVCTQQKRARLGSDQLSLYLNNVQITNVKVQKVLGVKIDCNLKFVDHIDDICKKIARHIFLLRKINDYLTLEARQTFYNSYILPCFDYCVTVWGYSSKNSLDRLYKYQKRIGRIILNDFTSNATDIFEILGWLTIYERRDYITLNQVYKCLYENFPVPLQRLFSFRNNQRQLPLRNTGIDLNIPIAKNVFRTKCFDFVGATLWNSTPSHVRNASSLSIFKYLLKKHILSIRDSTV